MLNTQTPNMPELRKDPIVHRWVVMSPDRASRPSDLHMESQLQFADSDPFAEGNESATTSEILAYRDHASIGDGPGWRVRVIPNKFPALKMTGNLNRHRDGIYEAMNGLGSHEVIVECPQCETNMSRLSADNIHEVLCAYRARLIDLKQDQRLVHATIFKNNGVLAGASLAHSHSQLIATPIVPVTIQEEIAGSLEFNHRFQRSIFEAMIQQELESGSRIVLDSPGFLAFCPYASRFPYEVCILPKHSSSHFENSSTQDLRDWWF